LIIDIALRSADDNKHNTITAANDEELWFDADATENSSSFFEVRSH
jgi:hypothetical protein